MHHQSFGPQSLNEHIPQRQNLCPFIPLMDGPGKRERPAESARGENPDVAARSGKRKPRHKPRAEASDTGVAVPRLAVGSSESSSSITHVNPAAEPASSRASLSTVDAAASSRAPSGGTECVRSGGRKYTVSIAVPGSILAKAQSAELQTYLAGQIARAATLFAIDEVIVFDDHTVKAGVTAAAAVAGSGNNRGAGAGAAAFLGGGDVCALMARLLQYAETPP